MRAFIFPRLTWITSCYAASVIRSGVTPLILRAPNATTRFSTRSSNFLQFHPKSTPETISEDHKIIKFSWGGGGACPQTSLAGALRARTGTPLSKILDPPLEGLVAKLRHGLEMVDLVSTNRVHVTYYRVHHFRYVT